MVCFCFLAHCLCFSLHSFVLFRLPYRFILVPLEVSLGNIDSAVFDRVVDGHCRLNDVSCLGPRESACVYWCG